MPENSILQTAIELNASTIPADAVVTSLQSRNTGLKKEEAEERLTTCGENKLSIKKKITPLGLYLSQFKNALTIILIIAALLIFFIYLFGGRDQSDLVEGTLILAIVFLITIVGFVQEFKAEKAIESLKKMLAYHAKVIRSGVAQEIDVIKLVPGDIVLLEEGARVPADIRLLQVANLTISEASLTGESAPIRKKTDAIHEEKGIGDQINMVFAGTTVLSGRGTGIVVRTGDQTEIGRIAKDVADAKEDDTPTQKRLNEVGRIIGFIILGVCAIVFVYIIFFAEDFSSLPLFERVIHSFIASVALAVAAIPEGLPAVVTISLALGTQRMLKRNVLVRKLSSIETLGSTDVICSDKTGTLTKGEMTVTTLSFSDRIYTVSGTGYATEGTFQDGGKEIDPSVLSLLLTTGFFCNNAELTTNGAILGDPTEAALLVCAKKAHLTPQGERVFEIPFSSERKKMSVVVKTGDTYTVFSKGAPEILLANCSNIYMDGKTIPLDGAGKEKILTTTREFSSQALRTLAFAYKVVTKEAYEKWQGEDEEQFEKELTFLGIQGMIDPPRGEIKQLITACGESGIRVIMITGDHVDTARAVASEIGITGESLTGEEIDRMTDEDFVSRIGHISIFARVNPGVKMRIVDALKKAGHTVAMTGDGVNDAPALKKADIGIAMGITGTDVAKEASDMVLLDDHFSTIIAAIEEGRGIYHNIRKFVTYLLSCNLSEVLIIFAALIFFQKLPLTATMLLWINVVTDGLPAIALGLDPAEKGILRYKPAVFQQQVISKSIWVEMFASGVVLTLVVLGLFVPNLQQGLVYAQASAFSALVILEMARVFMIRSSFKVSFFSNKWLLVSVCTTLLLQVLLINLPFTKSLFGLVDLTFADWGYIIIGCAELWLAYMIIQRLIYALRKRGTFSA